MMWLPRVWYLCYSGGLAFVLPYYNLYFETVLGFSRQQIGLLSALRPWLSAPCAMLLCAVADRWRVHTALLVGCFSASVVLRCLMMVVPGNLLAVGAVVLLADCVGAPVGAIVDASVVAACANDGEYGKFRKFASISWGGLSVIAGWLVARHGLELNYTAYLLLSLPCLAVAVKLRRSMASSSSDDGVAAARQASSSTDAATALQQDAAAAEAEQLKERLLPGTPTTHSACPSACCSPAPPALAEAAASPCCGAPALAHEPVVLITTAKTSAKLRRSSSSSAAAQLGNAAAATPAAESAPLLAQGGRSDELLGSASKPAAAAATPAAATAAGADMSSSGGSLLCLLRDEVVVAFLWRALIIGVGLGCIGSFVFLHVESLGGSAALMGAMLAANCATEVPAFHWQEALQARFPPAALLDGSMLLLALRLAGYGLLPYLHDARWVLILELLHGVTFATSWGAGIVTCKRLVPPHLNASMQGLFSSIYGGVGSGLGALLGGAVMQALGGQALFFICAAVVLGGWLLARALDVVAAHAATRRVPASAGTAAES